MTLEALKREYDVFRFCTGVLCIRCKYYGKVFDYLNADRTVANNQNNPGFNMWNTKNRSTRKARNIMVTSFLIEEKLAKEEKEQTMSGCTAVENTFVERVSKGTYEVQAPYNHPIQSEIKLDTPMSDEMTQRTFMIDQLEALSVKKNKELRLFFNMDDDPTPTEPKDLIKRIQDGKFKQLSQDALDKIPGWYDATQKIIWRDPQKSKDEKGFNTAKELKDLYFKKAEQDIMILSLDKGLEALRACEEKSFT